MRVQITLEEDDYKALIKLAVEEDRTVAGQARHMLRKALAIAQAERNMPLNARLPVTSLTPSGRRITDITEEVLRDPQSPEELHDST